MKKLIIGMAVFSLLVSSLSAKDETQALKKAIEEGSLPKVERAFELYKKVEISPKEREKQLNELVNTAQELATKAPEGQPSRLKSWLKRAAKLSAGTVLLGVGLKTSVTRVLDYRIALRDLERNTKTASEVYPIFIAGLALGSGVIGLGAWLFNKGMTDSAEPVVTTDAQAIFEFLEEAVDSL